MIALAEESDSEEELPHRSENLDLFARLAAAIGLLLLLACVGAPLLDGAAQSTAKEIRILPRLCVFLSALFAAMLLSGVRWRWFQALSGLCVFGLATLAVQAQCVAAPNSQTLNAMLLATQTLAILFAGLSLGRMISTGGELLLFLACVTAGDIWLSTLNIPENAGRDSFFALLRLPWPLAQGRFSPAPGFGEVLVCGAFAGCVRRLNLPLVSVVLGAFAGYCAASFLALPPWPAWPTLSVLLMTTGTLIGCWPDLELRLYDLCRALLLSGALMLVLALISAVRHEFILPPKQTPEPFKYRSFI